MKCPKCNVEAAITRTRYVDASDGETKVYREQTISCRNKHCTDYGKVISVIKNPIQLEKD